MTLTDFLLRKGEDGHDNFERLRESGFFFFVLDSFDEIPAVLDEDESSWLIEALSDLIARYIVAGVGARGVIASRLFRQPRIVHQDRSVYEIRPFTDDRLIKVIQNTAHDAKRLIDIVLTKRPDLGVIARNPLLLNLLIVHFNEKLEPPGSQKEMFETYLAKSIALARSLYKFSQLSDSQLYAICERIAQVVFEQPRAGLEISHNDLRHHLYDAHLEEALEFLVRSRIGRSSTDSGAFSFSHRRFNEYFLVRGLEAGNLAIPINAIQTDLRWRDALVLYSEIASDEKARALVDHAWIFAEKLVASSLHGDRAAFIEGRRAIRFLIEGFRNRPYLLSQIRSELAAMVHQKIWDDLDYIETKTFIDAIALLDRATRM